ncbi:MAG TPA: hypothetical protein VFS34_03425 [Thermoanaerobaculia bacterium]|nr:hypothetical protein [Thermoanaerobaculia bacterium]
MDDNRKYVTWTCGRCGQAFRWPADRPDPEACPARQCRRLDDSGTSSRLRRA